MCCKPQAHHGRDRRMWPTQYVPYVPLLVRRVSSGWFWISGTLQAWRIWPGARVRERRQPVWDHPVTGKPATGPRHRRWAGSGWEQAQGWRSRVIQDQRSHNA
jgi:hypothetical protein